VQVATADQNFCKEQMDASTHALSQDGVSVVEGGPGVGKTTAASAVKVACHVDCRNLILVAPSWAATATLKAELEHDGAAYALDKLLYDIRTGLTTLRRGDVVLLDEAGMVSTMQMLSLMRAAQKAGAKLTLQGDKN